MSNKSEIRWTNSTLFMPIILRNPHTGNY